MNLDSWDSVDGGYRADATCQDPNCGFEQHDFWQVMSCQDHGDGAPNLLLDGPEGEQTSDVERYRREAFCPSCDGGDDDIPNLTWDAQWLPCEPDGAILQVDELDYTATARCTWVECRACHFGWKEIYALAGELPDYAHAGEEPNA